MPCNILQSIEHEYRARGEHEKTKKWKNQEHEKKQNYKKPRARETEHEEILQNEEHEKTKDGKMLIKKDNYELKMSEKRGENLINYYYVEKHYKNKFEHPDFISFAIKGKSLFLKTGNFEVEFYVDKIRDIKENDLFYKQNEFIKNKINMFSDDERQLNRIQIHDLMFKIKIVQEVI